MVAILICLNKTLNKGLNKKVKQNPEYENEYEYTNEDVVKGGVGESAEPQKTGEQKPGS